MISRLGEGGATWSVAMHFIAVRTNESPCLAASARAFGLKTVTSIPTTAMRRWPGLSTGAASLSPQAPQDSEGNADPKGAFIRPRHLLDRLTREADELLDQRSAERRIALRRYSLDRAGLAVGRFCRMASAFCLQIVMAFFTGVACAFVIQSIPG